jgi:hypothetical protein
MQTSHSVSSRGGLLKASTVLAGGTAALGYTGFSAGSAEAIVHTP